MDCLHSHSLPQTHPPIRSPISVFPNSHISQNPDSDVSYPLCPGVVWLWVGWSSLSSRTPAWSACGCGRERSLRSADARCAHTPTERVCVCVSLCVCGTGVRRKAFSSSGWKEAAVYLLPSRTLPQTRPPPLGDVRPGQGVPRMHKPTHAKVLFSRFCSFIQWSHDPRAMILQRA